MATRRENGMGSILRRTQRNENSSPYKRRATRRSPPPKLQSSSSLSSLFSFLSLPFRRKAPEPASPPQTTSDSECSDDDDTDIEQEQASVEPEFGLGGHDPAATLSQLGHTLQQSIPKPTIPPFSAIQPSIPQIKSSATTSQIAPLNRPRRTIQPAFATVSRAAGRRPGRPSFPGGIGSYGGFSAVEPSPPPFTPSNPLETSFAANRQSATSANPFSSKPTLETRNLPGKTNSEVLAEFFAAKGKAPLTPEERKKVAQLIADSDAESSQSPDADPYNGVPSFSFLKASFPAPEKSVPASDSAASMSTGLSFGFTSLSARDLSQTSGSGPSSAPPVAPRRRRPINYGGSSKRSAAITKAGFTLREHQKLLERQKTRQSMAENVAPDLSTVGDKRGVRDTEEDGGGKRRRTNDGQGAPVAAQEPAKGIEVARAFNLGAQPTMPSPLRQMTKLNSPSPPRVVLRAQAPSPSSSLSRMVSQETTKSPPSKPSAAKPRPRTSLVADVMREMLAEDKEREKKEQAERMIVDPSVFSNPYEDVIPQPVITGPKVRKPRRTSARPAARSSATAAKQEPERPLSLIEKIEKTDVRPNPKKVKTGPAPAPVKTSFQPPTLTFTAPSPKDTTPKARRPAPIVEEPSVPAPVESDDIEIIDVDEIPQPPAPAKQGSRPSLSVEVNQPKSAQNGGSGMLGVPRQRPSFSLHSPARPSPLREMSVPIEDEEDEIMEIPAPDKTGSTSGFDPFGPFGSATNGGSFPSFGFSAPVPPPAPTLAHAQLPAKKEAVKIDVPLFTPKHELPEPKLAPVATKAEVPVSKPLAPAPETKPAVPSFFSAPKVTPVVPSTVAVPETKPALPVSEADTKLSAQNVPISALPAFSFIVSTLAPKTPEGPEARAAAELPVSKLPTFTFGAGSSSVVAPVTKTASFDWAAAGIKAPTAPGGAQWTCGTCSLTNPASATEKCTICEAPRPKPAAASAPVPAPAPAPLAKTASFDWAAAGFKAPTAAPSGQWTCGTCGLANPASVTVKCTICEAPKPAESTPAPAPAAAPAPAPVAKTASFDWNAAGLKLSSSSRWNCSLCGLSNNAEATKCTVCEMPR